jgi:hypothetical protein
LKVRLKKVLGRRAGNIQLFPVCEKDLSLRVIIEVRKEDEKKDDDDKSKKRRRRKKKKDEATQTREKTEGSDAEAKVTHEPGETGDGMQAEENLEPKRGGKAGGRESRRCRSAGVYLLTGWSVKREGMWKRVTPKGKMTLGSVNRQSANTALKGMSTSVVAASVPGRDAAQAGTRHQRENSGEATKSHAG